MAATDIMSLKGQMAAEPVEALMRMEMLIGIFIKRYVIRQNHNILYSGMLETSVLLNLQFSKGEYAHLQCAKI